MSPVRLWTEDQDGKFIVAWLGPTGRCQMIWAPDMDVPEFGCWSTSLNKTVWFLVPEPRRYGWVLPYTPAKFRAFVRSFIAAVRQAVLNGEPSENIPRL